MNLTLSDLVGTRQSNFKVQHLTIDASGLTAVRDVVFQDSAGTVALVATTVATTDYTQTFLFMGI